MRMGIGLPLKCGRSGSWSPAQLPDLAARYEAGPEYCRQDVEGVIACGDGDPIALWQDRSGNGYHLTQSDQLKRPTLRLVNGKWCVRFDGVNDLMTSGGITWTGIIGSVASRVKFSNLVTSKVLFSLVADFSGNEYIRFVDGNGYFKSFRASRLNAYAAIPDDTSLHTFAVISGDDYRVYLDNTQKGGATATDWGSPALVRIGEVDGTAFFNGDVYGLILDQSAWSSALRAKVEAHLESIS